jgi:hypothetical protein
MAKRRKKETEKEILPVAEVSRPEPWQAYFNGPMKYEYGYIHDRTNVMVAEVRGWGHLTGVGGESMDPDEAGRVQDAFGNHLVELINDELEGWEKEQ